MTFILYTYVNNFYINLYRILTIKTLKFFFCFYLTIRRSYFFNHFYFQVRDAEVAFRNDDRISKEEAEILLSGREEENSRSTLELMKNIRSCHNKKVMKVSTTLSLF